MWCNVDTLGEKAVLPAPDRWLRHPGPVHRVHWVAARAGFKEDAGLIGVLLEASQVPRDPFEARAVLIRKPCLLFRRFIAYCSRLRFYRPHEGGGKGNVTIQEKWNPLFSVNQ